MEKLLIQYYIDVFHSYTDEDCRYETMEYLIKRELNKNI